MEDVLEALIDYRGKTPKKSNEGILTLSAKSVKNNYIDYSLAYYISKEEYKKFMVRGFPKKGDILLTTEAPLGNVARLDRDDVAVAQRLLTLRGKEGVLDNDYLLYLLQSPYGQFLLTSKETGTTVTGIKQAEFRKIEIPLPPFEEQLRISSIIRSVDDRLTNNEKIRTNLLDQAQTILKLQICNQVFNSTLGDLIIENKKSKIQVSDAKGSQGAYPFFTSGKNILRFDSYLVDGINIFLNTGGNADVKLFKGKAAYSTDTWSITSKSNYEYFLYLYLFTMIDEINTTCFEGSALKHLQKEKLKGRKIHLPSNDDIANFNMKIKSLFDLYFSLLKENEVLSELRNKLISKHFNNVTNFEE